MYAAPRFGSNPERFGFGSGLVRVQFGFRGLGTNPETEPKIRNRTDDFGLEPVAKTINKLIN